MAIAQTKNMTEDYFSGLVEKSQKEKDEVNIPNIAGRIKSFSQRYKEGLKPGFPTQSNAQEKHLEKEKAEEIKKKNYSEIKMKIRTIYVNMAKQYKAQYGIDISIPSKNLDRMAAFIHSKSQNLSKTSPISNQKSYNTMIGNECRNLIQDHIDKKQNPSKKQKEDLKNSDKKRKGFAFG
jgi:hypothetical protein